MGELGQKGLFLKQEIHIPLATAAVEKWVFEPAPEGDKRVLVLEMPISFSL